MNLRRIDLASIQLAVFCAQHGSISAAARHAHLSVSGASHRLTKLERLLGYPIFVRHQRGLRLTEAGRGAVACAAEILRLVESLPTCGTSPSPDLYDVS